MALGGQEKEMTLPVLLILPSLKTLTNTKTGMTSAKMVQFQPNVGLKLSFLVFSCTDQLSRTLQGRDITIQEAMGGDVLAESHLRRQRNEEAFDRFYDFVIELSENLTEELELPRKKSEEAESLHHETPKDLYRQMYFEVYDVVCNELSR